MNQYVDSNEIAKVASYSVDQKADTLFLYLCQGYNLQEIGVEVFGLEESSFASQTPSMVTRCYGFYAGKGGQRSNKNALAKMGLGSPYINRNDFVNFVRSYPRGIDDCEILINYLKKCKESRMYTSQQTQTQYQNPIPQQQQNVNAPSGQKSVLKHLVSFTPINFFPALLMRWTISGTIWGGWFRVILTVFTIYMCISGIVYILRMISKSSHKVGSIMCCIISFFCAAGSVCVFPGNWIIRIGMGLFSILLMVMVNVINIKVWQ